jgi:uncharacterized protein YndB with AHSA1/START domain
MAKSEFVYVTYIRTTPEKLWQALIEPEFTRQFWHDTVQECAWEVGASWKLVVPDGRAADTGEVVEVEPFRKLVFTWRNHLFPEANAEGFSRLSYELEQKDETVKLTVTHSIERDNSVLIKMVSGGWPFILASLKSLLETGEPFEASRSWPKGV